MDPWSSVSSIAGPNPGGGDAHFSQNECVYRLPQGQFGYSSHVINLPQDVARFVHSLSQCLSLNSLTQLTWISNTSRHSFRAASMPCAKTPKFNSNDAIPDAASNHGACVVSCSRLDVLSPADRKSLTVVQIYLQQRGRLVRVKRGVELFIIRLLRLYLSLE